MTKTIFYTVYEVAQILRVHWQTVLNYIKRDELKAVKLHRGYRISESSLNKFIEERSR